MPSAPATSSSSTAKPTRTAGSPRATTRTPDSARWVPAVPRWTSGVREPRFSFPWLALPCLVQSPAPFLSYFCLVGERDEVKGRNGRLRPGGRNRGQQHLDGVHAAPVHDGGAVDVPGGQLQRDVLVEPVRGRVRPGRVRLQLVPAGRARLLRARQDGRHQQQVHRRDAVHRLRQHPRGHPPLLRPGRPRHRQLRVHHRRQRRQPDRRGLLQQPEGRLRRHRQLQGQGRPAPDGQGPCRQHGARHVALGRRESPPLVPVPAPPLFPRSISAPCPPKSPAVY